MNSSKIVRRGLLMAVLLASVACGTSASNSSSTTTAMSMSEDHGSFDFGEPADASSADRTVEIEAADSLSFDPSEVEVTAGETITFRVVNTGTLPHEFVLGDQAAQDAHEAEMVEMMENGGELAMQDEANAVNLAAGETKELTWHFTTSGSVLFGCHQPGHYAGGMKGTMSVDS